MARSLALCSLLVLACCLSLAQAGDRTLGTVSGPCKDQFSAIMRDHYADDKECADSIKKAMTTAPKSDADCPGGATAGAGSSVQKCMSKNQVRRGSSVSTSDSSSGDDGGGSSSSDAAAVVRLAALRPKESLYVVCLLLHC